MSSFIQFWRKKSLYMKVWAIKTIYSEILHGKWYENRSTLFWKTIFFIAILLKIGKNEKTWKIIKSLNLKSLI